MYDGSSPELCPENTFSDQPRLVTAAEMCPSCFKGFNTNKQKGQTACGKLERSDVMPLLGHASHHALILLNRRNWVRRAALQRASWTRATTRT